MFTESRPEQLRSIRILIFTQSRPNLWSARLLSFASSLSFPALTLSQDTLALIESHEFLEKISARP